MRVSVSVRIRVRARARVSVRIRARVRVRVRLRLRLRAHLVAHEGAGHHVVLLGLVAEQPPPQGAIVDLVHLGRVRGWGWGWGWG